MIGTRFPHAPAIARCLLVALALGSATFARATAMGDVELAVGATAPAIRESTAAGPFDSTTTGRPYVVEFFAVWCPHCQRMTAVLNALQQADGTRVDVIAVPASPFGFDRTSVLTDADLRTFAQRFRTTYRIGFDGLYDAAFDYGVSSFPAIYVVGADRRIVAVENGEVPLTRLEADVDRALAGGH
ncbi:MAG TPA: TlpA family protein disulfide reductase [Candidatus Sulfotelmatobacter sp.]|nr:TlpA family protein disulfide reductase [Candidatus Sulfotelmatobacter sp.]